MTDKKGITDRWAEFRPTKAQWLWSCAGCVAATMLIGFTVGGWVTGGTAQDMATSARDDGRAQLASALCVENFIHAENAAGNLDDLKGESRWRRGAFIENAGWTTLGGEQVRGAASLCAQTLAEMDASDLPQIEVAAEAQTIEVLAVTDDEDVADVEATVQ